MNIDVGRLVDGVGLGRGMSTELLAACFEGVVCCLGDAMGGNTEFLTGLVAPEGLVSFGEVVDAFEFVEALPLDQPKLEFRGL